MSYSYALTWTDHLGRDSPCGGRASRCYTFKLTDPLNPSLPSKLVPDVVKRCLEDPVHVDPKELVVGMRVLGYEETYVEDAIFLVVYAHKERGRELSEAEVRPPGLVHLPHTTQVASAGGSLGARVSRRWKHAGRQWLAGSGFGGFGAPQEGRR